MMSDSTAVILGILEGLTEFIPVSSTGHLILLGSALGAQGPAAETFEIFIQLGAILAVVALYFRRFWGLLPRSESQRQNSFCGWRGISLMAVACLPAFVLGALFGSKLKEYLFNPLSVAVALIFGGIAMVFVEKRLSHRARITDVDGIGYTEALCIGLFQCVAMWPGMSRSASTIIGGMVVGLQRTVAAEFSFLVAVPVMTAATCYDLLKSLSFLSFDDARAFIIGFIVSFVVALVAIRFFIRLLGTWTLCPFAYYRIVLGVVVLAVLGL